MNKEKHSSINGTQHVRYSGWTTLILFLLVVAVGVQGWLLYRLNGELSMDEVDIAQPITSFRGTNDQTDPQVSAPDASYNNSSGSSSTDDSFLPGNNWNPFIEMQNMRKQMDQVFSDAFNHFEKSNRFGSMFDLNFPVSPNIDLSETKDAYDVKVDMPGIEESTITTKLEGQILHIQAEQHVETSSSNENSSSMVRRERWISNFERAIQLPSPVDDSAMSTHYDNGVLTIHIPKIQV